MAVVQVSNTQHLALPIPLHCKTHPFAFQNGLFCTAIQWVLENRGRSTLPHSTHRAPATLQIWTHGTDSTNAEELMFFNIGHLLFQIKKCFFVA